MRRQFPGKPLSCPDCLTQPRRYFLRLYKIRIYKGRDGQSLDSWNRADRLLNVIRLEMDEGKFDPRNYQSQHLKGLVCSHYFEEWLKRQQVRHFKLQEISLGYLKNVGEVVRNHLQPFFGQISIKDISSGTIKQLKDNLLAKLQPKTVKNIMGTLHAVLVDAQERGDIGQVPVFPKIKAAEPVIRWIEEDEQRQILAQVKHPIYRAFYLFLMKMGCRPGEARALRWEDVDLKQGLAIIRAAMDINSYRPTTKEGDVRHLALHPEVWSAMRKLPVPLHKKDYVFAINGRLMKKKKATEVWAQAAKQAGIKISCYQGTKHSMGCQLINQGVPLEVLAAWFGHKDVRTTKRYAKIDLTGRKNIWESVSPMCPQAVENGNKTE